MGSVEAIRPEKPEGVTHLDLRAQRIRLAEGRSSRRLRWKASFCDTMIDSLEGVDALCSGDRFVLPL